MGLDTSLGISVSGLRAIGEQLRVVSNNIANAEVAGYTAKRLAQRSVTADGRGIGVATGLVLRNTETVLQRAVWAREAAVAAAEVRVDVLGPLEALHGAPEDGASLAGLVSRLRDAFIGLDAAPSSSGAQVAVVDAAQALAGKLNALAEAVTEARNRTQGLIAEGVVEANRLLGEAGELTRDIMRLKAEGRSTADLEDRRDAVIGRLSALLDLRVVLREDGGMLAVTVTGRTVPLSADALSFVASPLAAGAFYQPNSGTVPPLLLRDGVVTSGGTDITLGHLGGRLGALLSLRDRELPTLQAELDEFAHKLAVRFDQQGLRLFGDPSGQVPAEGGGIVQAGYVGFAATIRVSRDVAAAPRLVRDGTHAVSFPFEPFYFTPNPPGGPASFDTLTKRVLAFTFGAELARGTPHDPPFRTLGLGPRGLLDSRLTSTGTLTDFAAALVSGQTGRLAAARAELESERTTRDLLVNRHADAVGVNLDKEMALLVQLQNAYAANARVMAAAQAMWDSLIASVR